MSQDNESTNGNSKKRERKAWADRSPLDQEQSVLRSAQSLFEKLKDPKAKGRVLDYLRSQFAAEMVEAERKQAEEWRAKQAHLMSQGGQGSYNPFAAAIARES